VGGPLEAKIKRLQEYYWSDADPDGRGFVCLADAYRRTGDFRESLRILRDGLRRHPQLSTGHVVRGWVYSDQGDLSDAEDAFRAALGVDPQNIAALRGLGEILVRAGDLSGALEVYRSLLPLDPLDPDLPDRILELESTRETAEQGEETFEPREEEIRKVWDRPDEVAEELDWTAASLQADESEPLPPEPPAPVEAGWTEGEPHPVSSSAIREDALVTRTMGDIFLRQGLFQEAEEVFRRLLERSPGDRELEARLQDARARRGGGGVPGVDERRVTAGGAGPLPSHRIIPIQDLLPDSIVPIELLAPHLIVPVDDLAPDLLVPIESLAPDSPRGDTLLDAFEAWLDQLP